MRERVRQEPAAHLESENRQILAVPLHRYQAPRSVSAATVDQAADSLGIRIFHGFTDTCCSIDGGKPFFATNSLQSSRGG